MQDGASVLRQQGLEQPVKSVQDRNEVKWICEHQVAGTKRFDTLLWKIEFANVGQLHNDLRLVLPCHFQFQDASKSVVNNPLVAPRLDAREIFQEVRITINGTLFSIRPGDWEHLNWTAMPAEDRMTRDTNSRLPVAASPRYQSVALTNPGFAKRAKDFRYKSTFHDFDDQALNIRRGNVYDHDTYLRISHIVWKDWLRQQEVNTQKAGNLFEMLVELVFRKDASSFDLANNADPETAVWAHAFDVGSELCYGTVSAPDLLDSARGGIHLAPATTCTIFPYVSGLTGAGGNFEEYEEDPTFLVRDMGDTAAELRPSRLNGLISSYILTDIPDTSANRENLRNEFIQFADNVAGGIGDTYQSVENAVSAFGDRIFYVFDVEGMQNQHTGNQTLALIVWGSPTHNNLAQRIIDNNTFFRIVRNYFEVSHQALQWRCGDELEIAYAGNVERTRCVRVALKGGVCRVYYDVAMTGSGLGTAGQLRGAAPTALTPDFYQGFIHNFTAGAGRLSHSRIDAFDYPSPTGNYQPDIVSFYEANSGVKYAAGQRIEIISDTPAVLAGAYVSGFYEVVDVFEDTVSVLWEQDLTRENPNENFVPSIHTHLASNRVSQRQHFGGSLYVRPIRVGPTPVANIVAGWREDPYIQWERVKSQQPVPDVMTFPLTECEVYQDQVVIPIDGTTTLARLQELRVLTGWSRMYIYCRLRPESRALEYWTALRNILPRLTNLKIRINEKFALKGTESRRWLWRRFQESAVSDLCYQEWENQCMVCLRPEHLAYEDFFAGSAKLTTMGVEVDCGHSEAFQNVYKNLKHFQTDLRPNQIPLAGLLDSPYGATSQTEAFLRQMKWELRVVFEYSRKQIQLGSDGSVNVRENLISRPRDGLQLSTAVPRPIKVSGSHMEAYKK